MLVSSLSEELGHPKTEQKMVRRVSPSGELQGSRRKRLSNTWGQSGRASDTAAEMSFPMWCISVKDFIELKKLAPHQELLKLGKHRVYGTAQPRLRS